MKCFKMKDVLLREGIVTAGGRAAVAMLLQPFFAVCPVSQEGDGKETVQMDTHPHANPPGVDRSEVEACSKSISCAKNKVENRGSQMAGAAGTDGKAREVMELLTAPAICWSV